VVVEKHMKREFRKTTGRNKKPQVWCIGVNASDPSSYIVRWGVLGGVFQTTSDRPGSCGVKGHIDYQTPEEYVIFCIEREIRKKEEQGYVEYVNGSPVKDIATSIDFAKPLPKNLCFYKPKKEILDTKLSSLYDANRIIWTVKRDGMMHIAVKTKGIWDIYTRRMDLATEKFPHIVEALSKLNIHNNSILLGEMVSLRPDRRDDFVNTSRICRSDNDLALAYQGLGEFPKDSKDKTIIGKVRYYVFDIAYYNGKDVISTNSVADRLTLLSTCFSTLRKLNVTTGINTSAGLMDRERIIRSDMLWEEYVAPLQIVHTRADKDLELAKMAGLEGFVVVDANARYGDKAYSFDGKAPRPDGIWKRKPSCEQEFIIDGMYKGSGKNRDRFGGFFISQIHPKTGENIKCGKCGGGFTDKDRDEFLNDNLTGKTIKIKFDSRQPPKDGEYALRFPVFVGMSDKLPEECKAEDL
jgi:ATP-dependent DNA ligase